MVKNKTWPRIRRRKLEFGNRPPYCVLLTTERGPDSCGFGPTHQDEDTRRKGQTVKRFAAAATMLTMGLFLAGCENKPAPAPSAPAPTTTTPAAVTPAPTDATKTDMPEEGTKDATESTEAPSIDSPTEEKPKEDAPKEGESTESTESSDEKKE